MLVLTRKTEEEIKIGDSIVVKILEVEGGNVKIGIEAPREVTILRMEIFDQIQRENIESVEKSVVDIAEALELVKHRISRD